MTPAIKICGLSTPATLDAALDAGADMVGFMHFPRSPRHLSLEAGRALARRGRGRALRVAVVVDPDDALVAELVEAWEPDLIQLHGRESPQRVAAIRQASGRPVMKVVGIAGEADLAGISSYRGTADRIMLDAKPPAGAALPGGNGIAFDWRCLAALDPGLPFMLSGGLTPQNVAEAVALTGARAVDVSSGVESRPGVKDPERIEAFVRAARLAFAAHLTEAPLP